ncbi:UDP-glucuronosyltransferase 1A1-like [Diadema antillarum]|uniref:UDP-glucuronosyltransferase 1A1-like n=1 Tax=Diadema antillarum TaxID=105358 RepID=UPI003A8B9831
MYSEKQTDGDFSLLSALARGLVKNGHCVTALVSDCHYEELNDDTAYSHLKFDVFADSTTTFVRKNPFRSPSRRCLHSQTFNSGVSMTRHQQTIAGSLTRCSFLLDHVLTQRNQGVRYDLLIVDAHKGCSILLAGVLDVPYILVVPRDFPFPLAPNAVAVGGLTTRDPKPLDEDWMELISPTGEGVVLVALGTKDTSAGAKSGIQISDLTKLSRALAAIPQAVIWQTNEPMPSGVLLGANTKLVKWCPQNDLLGHGAVKLLIFSGETNSLYEAVYHGVPVVVIPIAPEGWDVAARVLERGLGLSADLSRATSEGLSHSILEVMNNHSFRDNARRVSAIMKERPLRPMDLAVHWIELILQHGGGYLRPSSCDLHFWQSSSLDVFGFLALSIYLVFRVLVFAVSSLSEIDILSADSPLRKNTALPYWSCGLSAMGVAYPRCEDVPVKVRDASLGDRGYHNYAWCIDLPKDLVWRQLDLRC